MTITVHLASWQPTWLAAAATAFRRRELLLLIVRRGMHTASWRLNNDSGLKPRLESFVLRNFQAGRKVQDPPARIRSTLVPATAALPKAALRSPARHAS
jgi:hypothetical protein